MNKNTARFVNIAAACAIFTALMLTYNIPSPSTDGSVLGANTQTVSNPDGYIPASYVNLGTPYGLLVLPNGNIWYVDEQNFRIVQVQQNGDIVRTVGRQGTGEGEFTDMPTSITRDPDGYLYVLTTCQIYKLDSNGGYLKKWGQCGNSTNDSMVNASAITYDTFSHSLYVADMSRDRFVHFSTEGEFLGAVGTRGTGNAQFMDACGIATNTSGEIYVVDGNNHRVQKFSPQGDFITTFGSVGGGNGQFTFPKNVVVLSDGKVAVTSQNSQKVQVFDTNGSFAYSWGQSGTEAWQFNTPNGIARDSNNNIYISDWSLKSIQKFTATGTFVLGIRNSGRTNGRFTSPTDVAYDSIGNMYVVDGGDRIQKFTNSGTYLGTIADSSKLFHTWHIFIDSQDRLYASQDGSETVMDLSGNILFSIGTGGTGDGQFNQARDVALDSQGNIYVTDTFNSRVQKFNNQGQYISQFGTRGTGDGQFILDEHIFIDNNDNIYVGDNGGCLYLPDLTCWDTARIQVFNTSGVWQRTINHYGWGAGQYPDISGLIVDSNGDIYTSSGNKGLIYRMNNSGTILETIGKSGSGIEEFTTPARIVFNPVTHTLAVADSGNHRVQVLNAGYRIYNLISSADVARTTDKASLVNRYYTSDTPGLTSMSSRLYFGDYVVSEFNVNLSTDRNWGSVNVNSLPGESKALVVNLNSSAAPGISATHSLFLVKKAGQASVHVCPSATTIDEVNLTCTNGYDMVEGPTSNLSTVVIDNITYWKISGLTGTGALSIDTGATPTPTPTITVTGTTTPTTTGTVSPTPTGTITITPSPTPTPTPSKLPITIDTLVPVINPNTTVPQCPYFESFTATRTVVQKGESVTFSWVTKNTELVKSILTERVLNPVDSYTFTPTETTLAPFIADNGRCNAKKQVTIHVVESLPWANSVAIGAGALAVEAVVATQVTAASFGNLWLAAAAFIDRKKRRSWGYVYDAATKKPLARAVIRLVDAKTNEVIDTVVSEANGAFRLAPKAGTFIIKVALAQYTFPSKVITSDTDGGYTGIYHGENFTIDDPTKSILISIPMDPMRMAKAQKAKLRLKEEFVAIGSVLSNLTLFGGLAYTLFCAINYPHVFNTLILILYIVIVGIKIALTLTQQKTQGTVLNTARKAVAGLELGLYDTDFKNLLYRTFTTAEGTYSFAAINQDYKLKLMDDRYMLINNGKVVSEIAIPKTKSTENTRLIAEDLMVKEKAG